MTRKTLEHTTKGNGQGKGQDRGPVRKPRTAEEFFELAKKMLPEVEQNPGSNMATQIFTMHQLGKDHCRELRSAVNAVLGFDDPTTEHASSLLNQLSAKYPWLKKDDVLRLLKTAALEQRALAAGHAHTAKDLEALAQFIEKPEVNAGELDQQKLAAIYDLALEFLAVMPRTLPQGDRLSGRITFSEQRRAELVPLAQEKLEIDEKNAKSLLFALNRACEGDGLIVMWDQISTHLSHAVESVLKKGTWSFYEDAGHEKPVLTFNRDDLAYEGTHSVLKPEKEREFRKQAARKLLSLDASEVSGPIEVMLNVIHETAREQAVKLGFFKKKTKLELFRDIAIEIIATPLYRRASHAMNERIVLDQVTPVRLQGRIHALGVDANNSLNLVRALVHRLSGFTKAWVEDPLIALEQQIVQRTIQNGPFTDTFGSEQAIAVTPEDIEILKSGQALSGPWLKHDKRMEVRIAMITHWLGLPREKQGVLTRFCKEFEKTVAELAVGYKIQEQVEGDVHAKA